MGFFSDLKDDLSQTADESILGESAGAANTNPNHIMTPEEIMAAFAAAAAQEEQPTAEVPMEETVEEPVDADMPDVSDISLEEMLKNIDNIALPEETAEAEPVPEAAEADEDPEETKSLEEMLAAAIAALPDQNETAQTGSEMPENLFDGMAEGIVGLDDAGAEEDKTAYDKTAYEALVPEEIIPDELVIVEPIVEEPQPAEAFQRELIADMPELEEAEVSAEIDFASELQAFAGDGQTVVSEQISPEESMEGLSAAEEPVIEMPAIEEPIIQEPVIEGAIIEELDAEEPVAEEPAEEVPPIPEGTSVIASGMRIFGDVNADAPVNVMGVIEGNVEVLGKLSVGGQIHGNIHATEIYAEGARLIGDVTSDSAVKLGVHAVVKGNIKANSAAIAGAVKGDIDVHGPIILDSTAIVVGNIKFKSIQINNGAIIEGMCLQCYADVSPTSFFDDDEE